MLLVVFIGFIEFVEFDQRVKSESLWVSAATFDPDFSGMTTEGWVARTHPITRNP
jgi:hypothetical protein